MKKLIPILFLLFSLNSFSQIYFSFPDSSAVWRIRTDVDDGWTSSIVGYTDYFLNGDTTINSILYTKMYKSFHGGAYNIDTANAFYFGALRESNKRVLFFPDTNMQGPYLGNFCYNWIYPNTPNYSEELLLYDFNAGVGDTVQYFHLDSSYIIINSIDSVLIQGQYRKRYNYSGLYNSGVACGIYSSFNYVEGIGNIYEGPFNLWTYYFENSDFLRCFEDENVLYTNVGDCSLFGVGIEEQFNENNLKMYPNPVSSNLTIELIDFNKSFKAQIYLTDITGKEVYATSINQSINTIDVSSFKSGLYLLKIVSDNGEVKSSLVSIQ
ncbi:MAG: hypothetical protein COA97_07550 [Flavobacteriales bacterium]|nr:MAG: hypothetical protein COA97_07550 [Flavobacteriales bacterium]